MSEYKCWCPRFDIPEQTFKAANERSAARFQAIQITEEVPLKYHMMVVCALEVGKPEEEVQKFEVYVTAHTEYYIDVTKVSK